MPTEEGFINVRLDGVFEITGRGHFALLTVPDKTMLRDGTTAVLDGLPVVVEDFAPRVLDPDGKPRLDVVGVKFRTEIPVEDWKARSGSRLALQISDDQD